MKTATALLTAALLTSCGSIPLPGGGTGTATSGWWKESTQFDPEARFGVLLEAKLEVIPEK